MLTLGAPNLDFTEVAGGTTCPSVSGGICTVEVQFQPKVAGRRQGSLVVSDIAGNVLVTVSLNGNGAGAMAGFAPSAISTFAGGSGGSLMGPTGIAADGFGNYYVADPKAHKVFEVAPSGVISTFAGTGNPGYAGDSGSATSAELNGPMDVVVDGAGFVYIADTNNNVVRVVDTAGTISTYAGQYYLTGSAPPGVCATATNSVGDGCLRNQIILNRPVALVFCHAQNLHIADQLNHRQRTVLRTSSKTLTQVGDGTAGYNGDGEDNTSADLNGPIGLEMDGANYIYVADTGNDIIRKTLLTGYTPNPIATVAGTPGVSSNSGDGGLAISAQLTSPVGVRVDPAGDIYISDNKDNAVRVVNAATGNISTIVGTGTAGYSGDGGPAARAELSGPSNIWLENTTGDLYIADTRNGVIRKVDVFDAPSLTFPTTPVGATSAAQNVTVMNLGNAPLVISQITTPAGYSLGGADTTCTASGETLDPGVSCVLGIVFTPQSAGPITGNVVISDNSTTATQSIALTNVGAGGGGYTLATDTTTVSVRSGNTSTATLMLSSSNYAGTVSFTTSVTSADGTAADVTASASSVSLVAGGSGTSTVTITTDASAANDRPRMPWKIGVAGFFSLLMLPLAFQRRRRIGRLILVLGVSLPMACSGSDEIPSNNAKTYSVQVTPTASPAATDPASVTITVTVQ